MVLWFGRKRTLGWERNGIEPTLLLLGAYNCSSTWCLGTNMIMEIGKAGVLGVKSLVALSYIEYIIEIINLVFS